MNILRSFTETVVTTPTDTFPISFEYDEKYDAVHVFLNDVAVEALGYTVSQVNAVTVKVEPAIPEGTVRIERETDIDKMKYIFDAGALFIDQNVDADFKQIVHSQQEVRDGFIKLRGEVLPLVHGLQEALKQAQEASQAAQEAADAAEEAAQVSRSADKVFDSSGVTQQVINNGVAVPTDLRNVPTPQADSRMFVRSVQCWYTYKPNLNKPNNDVTVVDKWEMDVQEVYYASWFAQSNTKIDQTANLQVGGDYATSVGRAYCVDALFYIDPPIRDGKKIGFVPRSKSVTFFKAGGSIAHLPTTSESYDIIRIESISNFVLLDPVLVGDKVEHLGTSGEWGYGLTIYQCKSGYIRNPRVSNTWGDGIYIGRSWGTVVDYEMPFNVVIDNPVVDGAGRNGISLCAGTDITINYPVVKNTKGKAPEAGIDIEPEEAGTSLSTLVNCKVHNATLVDNVSPINVFASKANRYIDVAFTGVTTFKNSNAQSADTFYFYKRATPVGTVQYGEVYIEHLVWDSARTNLICSLESPVTGLKVTVNKLVTKGNVKGMTFNYLGTALSGQPYGDFYITELDGSNLTFAVSKYFMTDATKLEIIAPIIKSSGLFQIYTDPNHYVTYASTSLSDNQHTWLGWSQNTRIMPNRVWVDPSVDAGGTEFITMYTGDDYREMTIGLHHDPAVIGNGAGINGLKLYINGSVKTTARTKTLGGWLRFKNSPSGRTKIIASYGDWVFS